MKVFVCSTCYDVVNLRAELHEDLRDLGVEALFSDLKESDFVVPADPDINSIEACLVNLRQPDVMIVILSHATARSWAEHSETSPPLTVSTTRPAHRRNRFFSTSATEAPAGPSSLAGISR
jgi:hypothetical protein